MKITNEHPSTVVVGLELTTTCNYSCWYCEKYFHDGKYRWPDLETYLDFFHSLCSVRENVHVDILGGEPTLWPKLGEFLDRKPSNLSVEVTTNGSRTVEWWKRHYKKFNMITFSFHPDTADVQHYKNVLSSIADGSTQIHVFFLAVRKHHEKLLTLFNYLKNSGLKLDCSFKIVSDISKNPEYDELIRQNSRLYDLSEYQSLKFFNNDKVIKTIKPNKAFLDGKKIDFHEFKYNKRAHFLGWTCKAGINRLWIKASGDIYRGMCENGGKIGNINFDTDVFNLNPTTCEMTYCGCRDEMLIEKWDDASP